MLYARDIIYDRAYNTSFHRNIESIQYNADIAITKAVIATITVKNNSFATVTLVKVSENSYQNNHSGTLKDLKIN